MYIGGLAYPAHVWTWADMVELGRKLTVRDEQGTVTQYGLGLGVDIEWWEPFILRNRGSPVI